MAGFLPVANSAPIPAAVPGAPAAGGLYLMARTGLDRRAFRGLLERETPYRIGVESGFAPLEVWTAMRKPPRLTLVCADEPSREVCDAIRMVAHLNSPTAILVFSAVVDPPLLSGWRGCPLRGYVVKDDSLDDLAQGIQALLAGGTFFSAGARAALVETDGATRNRLSRRESELLPLLARGCSLRDAAERMAISYKTADSYRTSLLRKLGLRDRVQLTRFAIREKIVDP